MNRLIPEMKGRVLPMLWQSGSARPCGIPSFSPLVAGIILATTLWLTVDAAHADQFKGMIERLDRLEEENRQLRIEIERFKTERGN